MLYVHNGVYPWFVNIYIGDASFSWVGFAHFILIGLFGRPPGAWRERFSNARQLGSFGGLVVRTFKRLRLTSFSFHSYPFNIDLVNPPERSSWYLYFALTLLIDLTH